MAGVVLPHWPYRALDRGLYAYTDQQDVLAALVGMVGQYLQVDRGFAVLFPVVAHTDRRYQCLTGNRHYHPANPERL